MRLRNEKIRLAPIKTRFFTDIIRVAHSKVKSYFSAVPALRSMGRKDCTMHLLFVNFMFPRRPTERHVLTFSTAERPVCVPYKRKPHRLNRRAAAPAASATVNIQKITKRAFDRHTLQGLKKLHNINLFVNFMFPRRPTERYMLTFSTAERPVCVPYKRKPHRLNRRAAAPTASATVNIQKIAKRAFDGRTMHRLTFTLCIYSSILCSPVARPNGTCSRFPPRNARCAFPTSENLSS